MENISDDFKVIHDADYKYFSEEDIIDTNFDPDVHLDIDDNNNKSNMNDHVLLPWGHLVKSLEDNLVCKECLSSNNKSKLQVTKEDVCIGTKIKLNCVKTNKKSSADNQTTISHHCTREISP